MAIAGRGRGSGPRASADAEHARTGGPDPGDRPAEFRYGAVFLIVLTLVVFLVVAPDEDWARAVGLALEAAALTVAIATSRVRAGGPAPPGGRGRGRRRGRGGRRAHGNLSPTVVAALGAIIAVAIPVELVGGLVRLVRRHGVTLQAVAGTLAIYLLVGLVFASTVGFVAHVDSGPYFAQGTDGTVGQHVYYSFTVLTTTGFGDLTAGTPVGRALAVVEMLVGQLYLVTVIGLVVGNFTGRRRQEREE